MKIRIKGDRIRLRLSKSEVSKLVKEGKVHDQCLIFDTSFSYQVLSTTSSEMYARYIENTITVYIPAYLLEGWETDSRVGFDSQDANGLYILVEKDFQCLNCSNRNEDESDLYPNPEASK